MRVLLFSLIMLIFCASCTFKKKEAASESATPEVRGAPVPKLKATMTPEAIKPADREAQKILHWFEQMDAIFRESLWVIRKERAPQGKSIFGKFQRALLVDMKQKLSNKSLFRCDVYSMTRNVSGLGGVPQNAEVMHQCNTKESFIKIGDWNHAKDTELTMNFRGGNLSEVLGFTTGILSPRISCKLKSSENGIIENFSCDGFMIDYNPAKNQVLRFNQYEYQKNSKNMLYIKAEVLENLDPVKKIEVNIPMEGKITVTETVLQQPEYLAKQVPATPTPAPSVSPTANLEAISAEDIYHDRNGKEIDRQENPQSRGIRAPKAPKQQQPQNSYEGVTESNDQANPEDQQQIQQQQVIQQPPQLQQGQPQGEPQQEAVPANGQDLDPHEQNREQNTR
ncbi:MAG: hypothetical protein JSU04_14870 [Bdellovibrionales bacterium]|nr:hypothetical protein [Bdellovibrionales bacterium]